MRSSADIYYDDTTSRKYTTSSRIQHIQAEMTHRALELLDLDSPSLILDAGCGSCLSGEILSAEPNNHTFIGLDVSPSMLSVALSRETEGSLLLADLGQGLPFRPGTFDAAISISAIQWLCNAESTDVSPDARLRLFFSSLYSSLRRGAKAVCQFYPKNDIQRSMITSAAIKAGFGAGLLEDDPGTKNAKTYLVLQAGGASSGDITSTVKNLENVDVVDSRRKGRLIPDKTMKGGKAWVLKKKEQMENRGKIVKRTSKYTGRKRRIRF